MPNPMKLVAVKENSRCAMSGKVGKCVVVELPDGRTRAFSYKSLEKFLDMEFADEAAAAPANRVASLPFGNGEFEDAKV